jgi:sulfatase modifying factor 1
MNKPILNSILVSLLLVNIVTTKGQPLAKELNIRQIEKSMVNIIENIYAGKYEVTNSLYRSFEQDLKSTNQTELLKIAMADSNVWRSKLDYNEPLVRYYHNHPFYENFPVVGVSYEGANLFCTWLTDKYNSNPKRKYKKVLFRLPTEREWVNAATGGESYVIYPWGNALKSKKYYMCNYRKVGDECIFYDTTNKKFDVDIRYHFGTFLNEKDQLNDMSAITEDVRSYFPNKIGLYNVCGNVAEMVQEKGIACGGSWKSPGCDVRIKSRSFYSKPGIDLGFRFFMEVIEK